jgi:hypothetical protein
MGDAADLKIGIGFMGVGREAGRQGSDRSWRGASANKNDAGA